MAASQPERLKSPGYIGRVLQLSNEDYALKMSFIWNEKLISIFSYRPQRYIQRYKYGNADAEELWDAIGEVRTIVTDLVFSS